MPYARLLVARVKVNRVIFNLSEHISSRDEWQTSGESTICAQTDLFCCLHWTHMKRW